MPTKPLRISKSQYLKGIQCPKALWLYRNRPDLKPDISEAQQHLFDTGHEIGHYAQQYFENGIEITEEYYEIDKAIQSTEQAIKGGYNSIFEATACSADNAFSRIDILRKVNGSDAWDLIEVKGSTGVKDYHISDTALQRYAFTGAGYNIRKSYLMHLNNQYVRNGDLELKKLFNLSDITKDVVTEMVNVPNKLMDLFATIRKRKEPSVDIGGHCYDPFECDYTGYCWKHIPDYSVYNIFRGQKLERLLSTGVLDPKDVPDDFDMTERESIQIQSYKDGTVYADKESIRDFLDSLEYPLYYLDYETIMPAIPLFDGTRPYQQIPFQFSLHIQKTKNGSIEHIEFLHTENSDPRPSFIQALIGACGQGGSVVVYNRGFESRINNELGFSFPEFKVSLDGITNRMVDLLVPFRSRYLYHPDMMGSASIKSVLPSFCRDMSYADLEIAEGGTASLKYLYCITGQASTEERDKIFDGLKEYCGQDTLAEVKLIEVLKKYRN
jgi:hypothetical protein